LLRQCWQGAADRSHRFGAPGATQTAAKNLGQGSPSASDLNTNEEVTPRNLGRRDRWLWVGLALLMVGVVIRAALYFPLAMYQFDSDAVLSGLCAFRIAGGHLTAFFPGGTRLSAASCYVAAAWFHLLGPDRVGLALTGLTWSTFYLVFTLLFLRSTLSAGLACVAYVFAVFPSEQFMTVTYAPWAYGEIMASCAATLWLAARWRNDGALWQRLGFGFSVGIGLWFSLETLMITLPAVAWIALKRGNRIINESVEVLPAVIVGAVPLLLGNAASGFATFTQNWASRPVPNAMQFFSNFAWVLSYNLPNLLFRSSGWCSETTVLMAAYAVAGIGFTIAVHRHRGDRSSENDARKVAQLLALAFAATVLIFSLANAGSVRGWTDRYVAPFYVVVPLFLGIGVAALWAGSRITAVICAAALLIPNLLLYGLPGTALRSQLTSELRNDERLRELLARRNVRLVYGSYVWAYHLNFDTHTRIAAVSRFAGDDYLNYGMALGTMPVRWAGIGNLDEIHTWARASQAHGSITMDGPLYVFIADHPAPNAAQLLTQLRSAPQ
jgi:hypothetical protein